MYNTNKHYVITTITTYDLISNLIAGGILGVIGQGIRIIVGLKKLDEKRVTQVDEKEIFNNNRLFISIFIGFIAGMIAILVKSTSSNGFTNELILAIIASGYSGADFIEGVFNAYFKKTNDSTGEKPAR